MTNKNTTLTPADLRLNYIYWNSLVFILFMYYIPFGCDMFLNEGKISELLLKKLKLSDGYSVGEQFFFLLCIIFILSVVTYIICYYTFIEKWAMEKYPDKP